jgi:hypothetical protein
MPPEVVFAEERLARRPTALCHRTVKALEAHQLVVLLLHVSIEVFTVARAAVWTAGDSASEVSAVGFQVDTGGTLVGGGLGGVCILEKIGL